MRGSDIENDPTVVMNLAVNLVFEVPDVKPLIIEYVSPRARSIGHHHQITNTLYRKDAVNPSCEVVLYLFDFVEFLTARQWDIDHVVFEDEHAKVAL